MKLNIKLLLKILFLIQLIVMPGSPFNVQASGELKDKTGNDKSDNVEQDKEIETEFSVFTEAGFEYVDNIFRLSGSQISTYNEDDSRDITSGRYKYMSSLFDYIVEPGIGIKVKSSSPLKRKLETTALLNYNYFINNGECSYPYGKIKLDQSINKRSDLILEGKFLYGFFKKNYLSGANDSDGNMNITRGERVYSPAVYNEYEFTLCYDYELIRKKDDMEISGLNLQPFAGCRYRLYNSEFGNRNQSVALGGMALKINIAPIVKIKTSYTFEDIFCPGNEEAVLFDENQANIDVNTSGELSDNAWLVTTIDRSCYRHTFEIEPSFEVTGDCRLFLGYRKRETIYTTDSRLDVDHYNQKKDYNQFSAGIEYNFTKEISAQVEWQRTSENDADDGKYIQNSISAAARYRFN